MGSGPILVNRAPVLTLWGAVVAQRLGYGRATALLLGKAVAGLDAQSKGRRLGIYPEPPDEGARRSKAGSRVVTLLGRTVPVVRSGRGLVPTGRAAGGTAAAVEQYLGKKLGADLARVEAAMRRLARSYPRKELAERAFSLYEKFRPEIPRGTRGWGAKGKLDLTRLTALEGGNRSESRTA
jgi:hypothetical protein